jgi:hypothetical protein
MIATVKPMELLRSPWNTAFEQLLSLVEQDLVIACPFIKRYATVCILKQMGKRSLKEAVRLRIITDLRPESTLAGAMDLDAWPNWAEASPVSN